MHRGFVPETTRQIDSIYDWIYSQHRRRKIPQAEVAKVLGVTREDYGYKLRNQRLSLKDFVCIMDFFGEDATACIK
jgi:hypothetical protein